MSFQWPVALAALVVVPGVLALYVWRERSRPRAASRFGNPALFPNLVDASPGWRRHLPVAVMLVALASMIVGVARPHATVSVRREQATVLLAVDVSRSMGATDVKPSRLDAARSAAEAFLEKVPAKYRVGLISFGTRAVSTVPPTTNRDVLMQGLRSLRPSDGTALGDALVLAVRIGQRQKTKDGTTPPESVLVISDGASQDGRTPVPAAIKAAKAAHVPVYSILVGTQAGQVTATLTGGYKEVIKVPPSPQTLQQVAAGTGGEFFAVPSDRRLRDVYAKLGSRLGSKRQAREVTDVFAAGSAALMLAGGLLSMFWFRRVLP
jgi:Ca-activated chloride channel family protein